MCEMHGINGGDWTDFLAGVSCGATIVGAVAATVSPDPISKLAWYGLVTGAVTCAGSIVAEF